MGAYSCPHCHKPIYDDEALLCLYCGQGLGRSKGFMGTLRYSRPRMISILITLLVVISFFLLMNR